MEKFNLEKHWDKFKNGKGSLAVNCKTEELANEFLEYCYEHGVDWSYGSKEINCYRNYEEKTCYVYNFCTDNSLTYSYIRYFEENNREIVSFEGFKEKFEELYNVPIIKHSKLKQPKEVQILNYKHIISDNKTVVLVINNSNRIIGKGVAVCLECDCFDNEFGFRLAKARALGDKDLEKKLLNESNGKDEFGFRLNNLNGQKLIDFLKKNKLWE